VCRWMDASSDISIKIPLILLSSYSQHEFIYFFIYKCPKQVGKFRKTDGRKKEA